MSEIKPFLCDTIDKSMVRQEWEKWLRSFSLYLEAEEISAVVKKKSKLLHLGGPQLQEIIYNIPGALVEYDTTAENDVYAILVDKLNEYFAPARNTVFERHIFRNLSPIEGESFNKFLVRLRQQLAKCSYGTTKAEIEEICMVDKIIDSWASTDLKKRFLEKEQTLDEIINACKVSDQITKHSQGILGADNSAVVSKISFKNRFGNDSNKSCIRCGYNDHNSDSTKCPARNKYCKRCNLLGHFAKQCKTRNLKRSAETTKKFNPKKRKEFSNVRNIEDRMESDEDCRELECFRINGTTERDDDIICSIGGELVEMVIDSGSPANLLSENHWNWLNCNNAVMWNVRSQSTERFRAYATDKPLKVLKIFEAPISVLQNREVVATFYVVEKGSQSLLGKKTATQLNVLKLGLEACRVEMVQPFPKIKNRQIKLSIDLNVKPVQQSLRRVPVAVEEKVAAKLDEACSRDIIEPVRGPSSWISPIVVVFKENGEIRLCIDMRLANKAILRENYPLPTFEMFIAKARGAKFFSRLDLKDAYHQLELHESSREITTFITHKGLFRYKRLLFGVNSAPEIFQRVLAEILSPCKNAHNYLDDVIIFGKTELEHDEAVREVLKICEENDVLLNKRQTPTELMFNRTIRDKLPDIRDLADVMVDSSARDSDLVNNQKGKEVSDKRRGARESTINVGDKVLVKNVVFPSKLTPNFDLTEYEVVGREGNEVELLGDGRKIKRNVSHCKKVLSPQPPIGDTGNTNSTPSQGSPNHNQGLHADTYTDSFEQCTHPKNHSDEKKPTAGLKLKLKKKGEMWQPCHANDDNEEQTNQL
ncbi:PREDICTED: uncharacterized protein LOC108355515 [Rhagoletis zephyria]|uniref:uncharacterized protein LOC108355515 n=1 Tax=Rhagoletis zephyria TaxID=28612 RepID=UPI0008118558|nr:PREDICTED: uncharacterized protein LOC108355515 [Rhagoletis zephyria]